MAGAQNKGSVDYFVSAIREAWSDSTRAILQVASTVATAHEQLDQPEITKLATLSGFSVSTLSKLKKIDERRGRFENRIKDLPAAWTLLYELARLSDAQFKRMVDERKLRPDLTSKTIAFYSGMFAHPQRPKGGYRLFATIRLSQDINGPKLFNLRSLIELKLKEMLKGVSSQLEFPETKSEVRERNREELAATLHELLARRLSAYKSARANLTERQYETLENAAWQHQHKFQKKYYPYPSSDRKSIENSSHLYSLKGKYDTRAKFLAFLRKSKIITPYNPISDYAALGEEKCMKFALEYCRAASPKARRTAKKRLDDIIKAGSTNARFAKKYLEMIEAKGAL